MKRTIADDRVNDGYDNDDVDVPIIIYAKKYAKLFQG